MDRAVKKAYLYTIYPTLSKNLTEHLALFCDPQNNALVDKLGCQQIFSLWLMVLPYIKNPLTQGLFNFCNQIMKFVEMLYYEDIRCLFLVKK